VIFLGFWSLLLTFLPWIAFKVILLIPAFDKLLMVKVAISAAALICVIQTFCGVHKGIIAWGSLLFFGISTVMVTVLTDIWYLTYLGFLSNATLALLTWASLLLGNPFTLAYARECVDPKYWKTDRFMHVNYMITAVWGLSFTACAADALVRLKYPFIPWYVSEIFDDTAMILAIIFTKHYSGQNKTVKPLNEN